MYTSTDYQQKFKIATSATFAEHNSDTESVFANTALIEDALGSIFHNPGNEPYMAAKNAAILSLSLQDPESFDSWVPEFVEEPKPEAEAHEICYDDGDGGLICEPTGATQQDQDN